eukprot:894798_1
MAVTVISSVFSRTISTKPNRMRRTLKQTLLFIVMILSMTIVVTFMQNDEQYPVDSAQTQQISHSKSHSSPSAIEMQMCLANLEHNMPIDLKGQMQNHHGPVRNGKWNPQIRLSPMLLNPPCTIWYVGAHTDGKDGITLQQTYSCHMDVFEQMPSFHAQLVEYWKYLNVPRATIHKFGLGATTRYVHNIKADGQATFAMEFSRG